VLDVEVKMNDIK
jgi:hypothetical protein